MIAAADAVRAKDSMASARCRLLGKAVLVYDMATGAGSKTSLACNITRECGDLVFQPRTVPRPIAMGYIPCPSSPVPSRPSGQSNNSYVPPRLVAEPTWFSETRLSRYRLAEHDPLLDPPRKAEPGLSAPRVD